MAFNRLSIEEKLLSKTTRLESGCLLFEGQKDRRGYGFLRLGGRLQRAHRLMYALHFGTIPQGLVIRHRCDNPSCIAIEHLEVGTQLDNVHDAWSRGRAHPNIGESNGRAKLNADQVREIRAHYRPYSRTHGAAALARMFCLHPKVVSAVINRKTWVHL